MRLFVVWQFYLIVNCSLSLPLRPYPGVRACLCVCFIIAYHCVTLLYRLVYMPPKIVIKIVNRSCLSGYKLQVVHTGCLQSIGCSLSSVLHVGREHWQLLRVKCRKFVVCHLHRRIVLSQDLLFHPSILCLANFCGVCCYLSCCRYCSIVFFQPQRLGRWTLCGRLLNISARCDFSSAIVLEMEDKLYNIAPVDCSASFYCCGMKSRLSGRLMTVASWDGWEINALNRH